MRFDEIMKLPYSDKDPRPTGEVVRDGLNQYVRDGEYGVFVPYHLGFVLPFYIPDHEIELEDLLGLVAVDCIQFVYSSNSDEMTPPKTAAELIKRFADISNYYVYGAPKLHVKTDNCN